jgi:hypothetical protein
MTRMTELRDKPCGTGADNAGALAGCGSANAGEAEIDAVIRTVPMKPKRPSNFTVLICFDCDQDHFLRPLSQFSQAVFAPAKCGALISVIGKKVACRYLSSPPQYHAASASEALREIKFRPSFVAGHPGGSLDACSAASQQVEHQQHECDDQENMDQAAADVDRKS